MLFRSQSTTPKTSNVNRARLKGQFPPPQWNEMILPSATIIPVADKDHITLTGSVTAVVPPVPVHPSEKEAEPAVAGL